MGGTTGREHGIDRFSIGNHGLGFGQFIQGGRFTFGTNIILGLFNIVL